MLRQSTFPRGGRLNRSRTRCHFERRRRFIRSNIIQPIVHRCHFERRRSRSREIPRGRNGKPRTSASPLARGGSPPRNPLRQKREQSYTTNPNTCPRRLCAPRWRSVDGKLCVRGIDTQRALWYNNPVNTFAPHVRKRVNGFVIASRQTVERLYNRAASERNGFVIVARQTVERLYNRIENDVPYTRFFDGTRKIY